MSIPGLRTDLIISATPGEAIQSPIGEALRGGTVPLEAVPDEFAIASTGGASRRKGASGPGPTCSPPA